MTNPVVTNDGVVERAEKLMRLATKISPIIEREDRGDGEERYIVKGVPCGFPVAKFGDCNDAELFVFAATELRAALVASDRDVLVGRIAELREALAGAKITLRGSSNNGCTVEIHLAGSGRGRHAMALQDQLKRLQLDAALVPLAGEVPRPD